MKNQKQVRAPKPIPIHAIRKNVTMAATAFLVTDGTTVWLTTCAHAITGAALVPLKDEYFEGGVIKILGSSLGLPLFKPTGKRFNVVVNSTDNMIFDALTVKLDTMESLAVYKFGAYDLNSVCPAQIGEDVTVIGFPGMKNTVIPESCFEAKVIANPGGNFSLSKPSEKGYSGGPVISKKGLVGIANGDMGSDAAMTNGLVESLHLLKAHLFK